MSKFDICGSCGVEGESGLKKMSLRTKGLILIVLISLVPLLIAGVGNYSAVKEAMLQSEIEKTTSKQNIRANNLASWMAIRKAEVVVMSRTEVVRFGTDEERLHYFGRELVRGGFIYHSIGFIDEDGMALRTDGGRTNLSSETFYQEATDGKIVITDPFMPSFSDTKQSLIVVPVYGATNELKGVVYASIVFSTMRPFIEFAEENTLVRLFNDSGGVIYCSNLDLIDNISLFDKNSDWLPVAGKLMESEQGVTGLNIEGTSYSIFHTKVNDTPWRFALQVPMSELQSQMKPIFWRIFTTIAVSELIIVIFFYLYFERIVKRLEGILGVTEQAAAGRFQAEHLEVEPHDEIGQLGHSVNGMMEHLQDMFDRLEAIINQNQYAFIVLDEHYKVTYLNKTAEEMLGYKTEELAGIATPLMFMDLDEIRLEAEKLTLELGREIQPGLEVFKELRSENFSYEREWTFIHKDGTRIPTLHSSNGLRDRNGRFSGVVGMVLDISDRKHMEKARNRLLDIVESAKDLIASVSSEGKVVYMNRAGREMLGLQSAVNGKYSVRDHSQPDMYSELVKGAALAKEFGFWESGAQLIRSDGEAVHVSMVVVAHQNEDTGELYFSCIARDISEQKLVQEELIRATLEAEEANQAKSSFLALMSHEIRTPLNGIIGLTQLMRKTGLSASQKDYMDKMNTSSETLLRLINDILDFSKIEAGKVDIERQPFRPDELMHRISDQLSVFMGGKEQFEFIIATPERLPQSIIGDALRLEQVLLNLCMNAIKFTNRGHVRLQLELVEESDKAISIRFTIADTGIGMSSDQVDKLFKPFTQADGSTTRKFGGTGLGLVISKSLVELMGGKLEVSSEAFVGSQFFFTLPFKVLHSYPEHIWRARKELMEQPVWIVEDDDEMRSHWIEIIESYGLTAIPFHSWKMARDRLRRIGAGALPKLIVLDMEMPDMYGAETWLEFHRDAELAGVKTIAMTTSYGRDEMMQLPAAQRPVTLLIKPIMRSGMLRAIESVLEQKNGHAREQVNAEPAAEVMKNESNTRILLAEDNKINQLVAIEILKEQGYEVGLAENGEEVLQKLSEEHWDLILMDIHMPVMDGSEAVRLIRSQSKYDEVPIIAVTANVLRNDHERYLKQGMNDVVTKPISSERLHTVISYWLKQEEAAAKPVGNLELRAEAGRMEAAEPAAKSPLPPIAGMDVDSAIARVNGKLPILLHMMEQFMLDYDSFADQLRMMVKQSELTIVKRMAHTLKGAAGYLSAYELLEAVCEVERIVKQPDMGTEELQTAINDVESALKRLLAGLRSAKETFDNNS
ncbi:response regulator [Paenibacillus luteus]|uniref:response regulator n=1 Tax=Paenibacillus luteus TaxID=2545753 RepID=UPI001141B80E|nr:response regulator [Paenibacillus luteus]